MHLKKTEDDSFFIQCHSRSDRANKLFCSNPEYEDEHCVILQLHIFEDDRKYDMIAELLYKKEKK